MQPIIQRTVVGAKISPMLRQFLDRVPAQDALHLKMYGYVIESLVMQNIWSKIDVLHWYAAADSVTALVGLKDRGVNNGTAAGGETFVADQGYTNNGTTGHIVTPFIPSTAGGQMTLNSTSIGGYLRTSYVAGTLTVGTAFINGSVNVAGTSNIHILPAAATNDQIYSDNDGLDTGTANAGETAGMWISTRVSSTSVPIYQNGILKATLTQTSVALVDRAIWTHSLNDGTANGISNTGTSQVAMMFVGGAMTASDAAAFSAIVNNGMRMIGANKY